MSTERVIVDQKIADQFVARFVERTSELSVADPARGVDGIVGPMIVSESGSRINSMLDDALSKGAALALGDKAAGAIMPATIVDSVTSQMRIYDEETFGPVTAVIRAKDTEDAIRIANSSAYGLSASVFGKDVTRALRVAMALQSGICHINGATVQNEAQAPYGGTKDSGYGRFDGRAVIDEFTELKWVTLEPSGQPYPF